MAKLIDQIDSSGLFAQSAYSAAIATNDDLGRKISETYLTAVDLSPYATTAQVDTVSSLLSAGLDYVSANGGKTYTGISPIVVNNDEVKISAETWDLSAGNGISFTDFDAMGITRIDVTGTFDNTAVNQVVKTYSAAGKWLTAHQSLDNYYQKTDTSSKQEISAALTALNNDLSAAIDYVSANGGKTYTGVAPIQVNNNTDQISITGQSLSAGPNIDLFSSGGYVVISANGGAAGKTYTGIAPIQVDNVNDEISVDCGVVSAGPGIDIVSDANGIKFSATNFYYSNNNPTTATTSYSGLYIEKDYQQGKTTRTFYAGSEAVGELVPTGYSVGNYLTTTVAGMTWAPLPDYGAPVVLVATSGDIPASGSSDNKVYIVTGTV